MSDNTFKENMEINNVACDDDIPIQKPLKEKKPRKPKTEKQLEQFKNACLNKRQENIKQKNLAKKIAASKILLENGYVQAENTVPLIPISKEGVKDLETFDTSHTKTKPKEKVINHKAISDEDSEESDNDIIIIKKKKKPKKKTYIIEESSDDEEEEQEKVQQIYKQRQMVSQQNKRSIIKIHTPNNYFVD